MKTMILAANIAEATIWLACAATLLLTRSKSGSQQYQPYINSKRFMAAAFMSAALSIVFGILFGRYTTDRIEILNIYSLLCFYLTSSMMLLSILSLFNLQRKTQLLLVWLFGPTAILLLIHLLLNIINDTTKIFSLSDLQMNIGNSLTLMLRVMILVTVVIGIIMVSSNFVRARKSYIKILNDFFSGEKELGHIRWIDQSFIITLIASALAVGSFLISSPWYDLIYSALIISASVLVMIRLIRYEQQITHTSTAVAFADETETESTKGTQVAVGIILLQWVARADKPYLQPGLTLADLADSTGVSKHRITEHLNKRLKTQFCLWVNILRIREVERLLSDRNCDLSLSQIANSTGFDDLAALNNSFKLINKITPTQFRHNKLQQN